MVKAWATIKIVGKIILIILIVVAVGWFCLVMDFNIGGLIRKIWAGEPETYKPKIIGPNGQVRGLAKEIQKNSNPLRDRTKLKLEGGEIVQLPKGVLDTDVSKVIEVKQGVYDVQTKHELTTGVFD